MKTYNYYDFEAMEVNPPHNRRTPYGITGTALSAPKRGDYKNWRKLFLYVMSRYRKEYTLPIKPMMVTYKVTQQDIDNDLVTTKSRIVSHKTEAHRMRPLRNGILSNLLFDFDSTDFLPSRLGYLSKDKDRVNEYRATLKKVKRLTSPKKKERMYKLLTLVKPSGEERTFETRRVESLIERGIIKQD